MSGRFEVIYLTGAPAAGKSTTVNRLCRVFTPLEVFSYGAELKKYLDQKEGMQVSYEELRRQSSGRVTPADIEAVDSLLISWVRERREVANLIIDTHAVTKECYGFRVTPFSLERIAELRPSRIVVFYTSPEVTIARIRANPGGRPEISNFESGFHTGLQAAVAISYSTSLGIPSYFLDGNQNLEEIVNWFSGRLSAAE